MDEKAIFITGNPVDGYSFTGPFDSMEEAIEYGEQHGEGDWWVSTLKVPEPMETDGEEEEEEEEEEESE